MSKGMFIDCEACILAGGLGMRMGRDKATMRLGGRSLLAHVRSTASLLGIPVRVIRRDLVPRCGPLGGVYTALRTSRASTILFLSCDMPFVPVALLERMLALSRAEALDSLFVSTGGCGVGFPFLLGSPCIGIVSRLLKEGRPSLQRLAAKMRSKIVAVQEAEADRLLNLNSPADLSRARAFLKVMRNETCL